MKTSYLLHRHTIGVVAVDDGGCIELATVASLIGPTQLLVDCDYTPPPRLYLVNGEPDDEPDPQECLDIMRIESATPLYYTNQAEGVAVTLMAGAGYNLCPYFTDSGLIVMELALLKDVRAAADQTRIDLARQP